MNVIFFYFFFFFKFKFKLIHYQVLAECRYRYKSLCCQKCKTMATTTYVRTTILCAFKNSKVIIASISVIAKRKCIVHTLKLQEGLRGNSHILDKILFVFIKHVKWSENLVNCNLPCSSKMCLITGKGGSGGGGGMGVVNKQFKDMKNGILQQ